MPKLILRSLMLAGALCASGCASVRDPYAAWLPPPGGVVRDKAAAIAIAHAVWFSANPSVEAPSEAVWQQAMQARLDGKVWHVYEPPLQAGVLGGRLQIDLSATDGRILRIVMTQ